MTEHISLAEYKRRVTQMSVSGSGRLVQVSTSNRNSRTVVNTPIPTSAKTASVAPKKAMFALGRLKTGEMNKTEAAYSVHLESRKAAGDIVWFKFEGITFKLADDTRYTPDFSVMLASGQLQAHEVKGHWMDDSKVKIKVAAAMFPIEFIAVKAKAKKDGGGWAVEEF